MRGLDETVFGSWISIISVALLLGSLFALAASLVNVVTGGDDFLTRQSLFLGLLASVAFVLAGAWVRQKVDEESKG
jgi:hypothetical protein